MFFAMLILTNALVNSPLIPAVVTTDGDPYCQCPSGACWGTNESCIAPAQPTNCLLSWVPGHDTQSTNRPLYEVVLGCPDISAPLYGWEVEGYVTNSYSTNYASFVMPIDFNRNMNFTVMDVYSPSIPLGMEHTTNYVQRKSHGIP